MKTLSSTYFKFPPLCKYRDKDTAVISGLSFLGHQKHFSVNVSLFSQYKFSHSNSAVPSSDTLTTDEGKIQQIIDTDHQKTVHVRFQLQKECAFGQQFLIVGDDPVIGSWEPSDGVPLIWSDGHLWTTEVDLPIGRVINYKFVLKEESGTIYWQLGPDRFLEPWDTEKAITVFEDWDIPELQKIVESDLDEESLVNSELVVVEENLSLLVMDEWTNVNEELDTNGSNSIEEKAATLLVAENIVGRELDLSIRDNNNNNEIIEKDNNLVCSDNETRLITDEGVRVLVPGLISIAREEIEELLVSKVEIEHDKSTTSNVPNVSVGEVNREHDKKSTTSNVPNLFISEVEGEHDKSTTSDVQSVSEVENEHDKNTTSDVPSVLASKVESEQDKSTTSDVPSVLASIVENEHDKSTTSDVPSVVVSKVESEHDKSTTSDVSRVLEEENGHDKTTTSDIPNLFASEVETEHDERTTSSVPNDVEELDVTELKEEHVSSFLDSTETNQEMIDNVQEEKKRLLDSVLKGYKQWGRQTLQKFLASLGFQSS